MPKNRRRPRIPVTSATQQAREALIQADVLEVDATRARTATVSRGTFGSGRSLRAAGSVSNYLLGPSPTTPPSPRSPKPKRRRPLSRAQVIRNVARRRPGLSNKQVRNRARKIRNRRA